VSYLIDTNVVSALAPSKRDRPQTVIDWLESRADEIYISVVTSAEIRAGIAKSTREGAGRKAEALALWWEAIEGLYGERILPFDLKAAAVAGAMIDRTKALGLAPGFADIVIAATAEANNLVLLTRNKKHFRPICANVVDPFETRP
jgi:predicted nucleic acid-binding protein